MEPTKSGPWQTPRNPNRTSSAAMDLFSSTPNTGIPHSARPAAQASGTGQRGFPATSVAAFSAAIWAWGCGLRFPGNRRCRWKEGLGRRESHLLALLASGGSVERARLCRPSLCPLCSLEREGSTCRVHRARPAERCRWDSASLPAPPASAHGDGGGALASQEGSGLLATQQRDRDH